MQLVGARKLYYFLDVCLVTDIFDDNYWLVPTHMMLLLNLFQRNPVLITDLRDDIKKECEKFGEVRKVMVFDVSILFLQRLW